MVDVVAALVNHHYTGLPVVDENRRLEGVVSKQDCIHTLLASCYFFEGSGVVEDVTQPKPLTLSPPDAVLDLARSMTQDKPRIYPVSEDGVLVGLVTRKDVLKTLREQAVACSSLRKAGWSAVPA